MRSRPMSGYGLYVVRKPNRPRERTILAFSERLRSVAWNVTTIAAGPDEWLCDRNGARRTELPANNYRRNSICSTDGDGSPPEGRILESGRQARRACEFVLWPYGRPIAASSRRACAKPVRG